MKDTDKALKEVLEVLGEGLAKKEIKLFEEIFKSGEIPLDIEQLKRPSYFYYALGRKFELIQKGAIKKLLKNDRKLSWLFINYRFIERQYKEQIKIHEGMVCSADKSSHIITSLVAFLIDGTRNLEENKK